MDLNKFTGTSKAKIFHSSEQARSKQGEKIGSTNQQTFQGRLELMKRQRKNVRAYRHSRVAAETINPESFRPTRIADVKNTDGKDSLGGSKSAANNAPHRSSDNSSSSTPGQSESPKRTFVEPPKRNFDPYN